MSRRFVRLGQEQLAQWHALPLGDPALAAALALAQRIAAFPQQCLRADRAAALAQWDLPLPEALMQEGAAGRAVLDAEGRDGAARFAAGAGRHGRF